MMGDSYTELIPAAILYNNNGLTREEYAKQIFDLRKVLFDRYQGLHGIASILHLNYTDKYTSFKNSEKEKIDSFGLQINPMIFHTVSCKTKYLGENTKLIFYKTLHYSVNEHLENILGKEEEFEEPLFSEDLFDPFLLPTDIKAGDTFDEWNGPRKLIIKISDLDESNSAYTRKVVAREMKQKWKNHLFNNLNELITKFPVFNPDNMYDFNQSSGIITAGFYKNKFYWIKKGDKYYLDTKTFDNMRDARYNYTNKKGERCADLGYNDFILTSEAVKKEYFPLIDICGGPGYYTNLFLEKYPDSFGIYEKAVRDGYTSLFAKSEQLSYTELLRLRILNRLSLPYEDIIRYKE